MTALAFALDNPNYSGPSTAGDLLARDVLAEKIANHGLVNRATEEMLAAEWEQQNRRALVRSWEETDPVERENYHARAASFAGKQKVSKINMDPTIAEDELRRLEEQTSNPADYIDRINELREFLGRPPAVFGEESLGPSLVREDQLTPEEQRWKAFLSKEWPDQLEDVNASTDLVFLERALHGPRNHVIPKVRKAVKDRIEAVKALRKAGGA